MLPEENNNVKIELEEKMGLPASLEKGRRREN